MFYTYIVASQRNGTLYAGSTDDLIKRIWEHKEKVRKGSRPSMAFTSSSGTNRMRAARPPFAASARSRNGGDPGRCG